MLRTKSKRLFIAAALVSLVGLSACIMNPVSDKQPPPKSVFTYLDLTHKEDALQNLVTSYKQHNIDEYSKILHSQYIWRNQDTDIQKHSLPEFVSRSEDIQMTTNLFLAADKRHPDPTKYIDKLELKIEDGSWDTLTTYQGNPCQNCWQTTREYFITVVMSGGDLQYYGNDLIKVQMVPETVSGKVLYRIGRIDDIQKSLP